MDSKNYSNLVVKSHNSAQISLTKKITLIPITNTIEDLRNEIVADNRDPRVRVITHTNGSTDRRRSNGGFMNGIYRNQIQVSKAQDLRAKQKKNRYTFLRESRFL